MKDSFQTHETTSNMLRNYISYYYFHSVNKVSEEIVFTYYPHYKNALTIYKNSKVEFIDETYTKTTPSTKGYSFCYAQLMSEIGKTQIHSPFNKIGVVFQPLGLNYFIDKDLSVLLNAQLSIDFNFFKEEMNTTLDEVYKTSVIKEKVKLLDAFFENAFVGFKEKRLENAIWLITTEENKQTVQGLAEKLGLSRKTLLRLFKKHLNCTVKEYINLVQFRKAVDIYQKSDSKPSLTSLAYDMDYYDQSEFIHHFHKITGTNPKLFFDKLVSYGNKSTYWSTKK